MKELNDVYLKTIVTTPDWFKSSKMDIKETKELKCIYKFTSPSGRIYIGKTVNLYNRIKNYITCFNIGRTSQPRLHKSFMKYGIGNHEISIIEKCNSDDELLIKEIYYIKLYNSFSRYGLNLTIGGDGASGRKMTEANKIKLIAANKIRVYSELTLKRMSIAHKGKTSNRKNVILSEETKQKISDSKKSQNKRLTDDHKHRISIGNKGKKVSVESILKGKETRKKYFLERAKDFHRTYCKVILQYDLNGNFIKETTRTDLRLDGISADAVKRCLNGKSKTSNGFIWAYKKI